MSRFVSILAAAALVVGLAASQASSSNRSTLHRERARVGATRRTRSGTPIPPAPVGFRVYLGWQDERRRGRSPRPSPIRTARRTAST